MTGTVAWEHGNTAIVCGEMAGDPRYTALLIGLGIHELSMSPVAVPRVKERICLIDTQEARRMASHITDKARDSRQISQILDSFNDKCIA